MPFSKPQCSRMGRFLYLEGSSAHEPLCRVSVRVSRSLRCYLPLFSKVPSQMGEPAVGTYFLRASKIFFRRDAAKSVGTLECADWARGVI